VNQDHRCGAFEQYVDLSRTPAGGSNACAQEQLGEQVFDHFLMASRDCSRGVARHLGQFKCDTGESRTEKGSLSCPFPELAKQACDDGFRLSAYPIGPRPKRGQRKLMLVFQGRGDQVVLAPEVIVDGSLCDAGSGGDLVHADTVESVPVKEMVGTSQDCLFRICQSRHLPPAKCIPHSERMYTA
jgi:hypothetical protein